ncbi:hypothetical protein ZWY2020_009278 [Hordeum vulgare]|nr:hypothetical protein ZWY2020_009278 [Hordeum vulgare]
MAKSYHCLRVNLSRLLMQKADEEGGVQFVREVKISDSPGFVHEIPSYQRLLVISSLLCFHLRTLIEYEKHFHGEVKLLFASNTMYHLGFSADDVWRVFKDAILPGVEKQNEAEYNIVRLDFGGRYQEIRMNYKELITGFDGQLDTYSVLVDLQHATRNQIVKVSCRNVVTFSEPIRFPFLFKLHVTNFQQGNLCAVIDAPVKEDETYRNMSSHFTSWGTYSDKCRGGREKFDEEWELHYAKFNKDLIPGIPTYESLLSFLFLLSNKDHNKTHKDEQPEKHIKHSFANPEDHKKEVRMRILPVIKMEWPRWTETQTYAFGIFLQVTCGCIIGLP